MRLWKSFERTISLDGVAIPSYLVTQILYFVSIASQYLWTAVSGMVVPSTPLSLEQTAHFGKRNCK